MRGATRAGFLTKIAFSPEGMQFYYTRLYK